MARSTFSKRITRVTLTSFYKSDGKGYFDDMTSPAGLNVETRYIGWGAGMVDLDNDGFPDLFGVTSGTYPGLEKELPDIPWKTRDSSSGILGMGSSKN
jgi:hypothetical protein